MDDPIEAIGLTGIIVSIWAKITGSKAVTHEEYDAKLASESMAELHANDLVGYYKRNDIDIKHLEKTLSIIENLLEHTRDSTINVGFEHDVQIKSGKVKLIKLE